MIRERRDKEKLEQHYQKFLADGSLDVNVHPWVAESWKRCRARKTGNDKEPDSFRQDAAELEERMATGARIIEFMDGLCECLRAYCADYQFSVVLLDEESYILKNYSCNCGAGAFAGAPGARVAERDIGTSSVSIAREHKVPFLLFGAEAWPLAMRGTDSCAAPIMVGERLRYLVAIDFPARDDFIYDFMFSLLLTIKYSLENYLAVYEQKQALCTLLDEMPFSVYCVRPGGKVTYANANGRKRLDDNNNLSDVFLNYEHIPLNKGFQGVPLYNKESLWIARGRTYEDITTVLPLKSGEDVDSVVVASFSVEDLKTIVAHASGYNSRYSIFSMAGTTENFVALQNKAARIAKSGNNILLQGEPGTGKQRLAHGIHQASVRAANPFIVVKCGKTAENILDMEIFGYGAENTGWVSGKLELADAGTLFIDEVEKMPVSIGDKLAKVFAEKKLFDNSKKKKVDIRLIAACDSNLKRLSEKGLFSKPLYNILSQTLLRVPALRERTDDIEVLSNHILYEMALRHNLPPKHLSPEALSLILQCSWPGNIKQLQGVLEIAFFHTPGYVIGAGNIKMPSNAAVGKSWKHDRDAFIDAWKAAGGNISRLGLMLDVSRVTLYRYLKKYGLAGERA
ncbi:MAG: sigma 54-interacting transcriptional regulator [Acidaminococcales bacterium]|jgi:transcriptional regulator of acetoin/glycerol metabolism|nr:sigma 54-interacting transcriptional regulator [Acidaminococcales bacterium]